MDDNASSGTGLRLVADGVGFPDKEAVMPSAWRRERARYVPDWAAISGRSGSHWGRSSRI